MERNNKTVEKEKCTLYDLEYGEKTENHGNCRMWKIARNSEKREK